LPTRIERHIKLFCYYDPRCDPARLARQIEGRHPGVLRGFLTMLMPAMNDSNIYRLRRAPAGWH
jgi:hypothetical protein